MCIHFFFSLLRVFSYLPIHGFKSVVRRPFPKQYQNTSYNEITTKRWIYSISLFFFSCLDCLLFCSESKTKIKATKRQKSDLRQQYVVYSLALAHFFNQYSFFCLFFVVIVVFIVATSCTRLSCLYTEFVFQFEYLSAHMQHTEMWLKEIGLTYLSNDLCICVFLFLYACVFVLLKFLHWI